MEITSWVKELQQLSDISIAYPQAAYAAFTHGFISKWKMHPNIQPLLSPLEETIRL